MDDEAEAANGGPDRSLRAELWECVRYGLMPWWTYEDAPHFAPQWSAGYHWWVNLRLLGRLLRRAVTGRGVVHPD